MKKLYTDLILKNTLKFSTIDVNIIQLHKS